MISINHNSSRIDAIDLVKGVTILLVLAYHMVNSYSDLKFVKWFASPFFMQLFFFSSGLFFSTKKTFKDYLLNKINRLIIPMLFFYFFNYFMGFISGFFIQSKKIDQFNPISLFDLFNGKEHFTYAGAIWFLLCLFIIYLIYYPIAKFKNLYIQTVIVVFLSSLGYMLYYSNVNLPYFIDSALSMLIYFHIGSIIKSKTNLLIGNSKDLFIGIVLLLLYLMVTSYFTLFSAVMLNEYNGNIFALLLASFLGIGFVLFICKALSKITLINYLGQNSLIILGTHQMLIVGFAIIYRSIIKIETTDYLMFSLNFVSIVVVEFGVIYIMNKYLPFFVGRKDIF